MKRAILWAALPALGIIGCEPPGKPDPAEAWVPPSKITDFDTLYRSNCSACHSIESGVLAAGQPMNNPLYIQWAGRGPIYKATSAGIPGTMMPVFLDSLGGALTPAQVDIVVDGILALANNAPPPPSDLPAYAPGPGDPVRGAEVARLACASCHGADGTGGDGPTAAGSIVDPAYLGLVSDQALKTAVVIGREDLGMPDYRGLIPGRSLSNEEIDDVVAWMASHRMDRGTPASRPTDPAVRSLPNSQPSTP